MSLNAHSVDFAIVGSGSAAFAAAIRARSYGASVLMVESATLGGTCVNVGCVPSKFVLHAAEMRDNAFDLPATIDDKDALVATLRRSKYEELVERYGFSWRRGTGQFANRDTLLVDGEPVRAGKYLIATGSRATVPPIPGLADVGYLTSTEALDLRSVPKSIGVIGGNSIGLELAQYFNRIGSHVVVFEARNRIAPFEEPEVSEALATALTNDGIELHTGVRVESVAREGGGTSIRVTAPNGGSLHVIVDEILIATGRKPNVDRLALAAAGVQTSSTGAIVVNEQLRTANPNIYAAGDVTGGPQFVYVAGYEGALAADNAIGGLERAVNLDAVPRVIFTTPEVAAVGMTEYEAVQRGFQVKTSLLPIGSTVPRAIVNKSDGVLKIVADATTNRILGVHIASENASEVIQSATLAVKFNLTVNDLLDTFHPYLTMAESLKLGAQSFERDVASLSCCAT